MIYKYCRRCGKRLKGEENRLRGYGKICYAKAQAESKQSPLIPQQLTLFTEIDKAQRQGAKSQGKAKKKESAKRKQGGGNPPHLEETLTPTQKTALFIIPTALTPYPD